MKLAILTFGMDEVFANHLLKCVPVADDLEFSGGVNSL